MQPANLYDLIQSSAEYLRQRGIHTVHAVLILGSGLSSVVDKFNIKIELKYADVPHFVAPSVKEHSGRVLLCEVEGKSILCFVGRVHYYEGYDMWQVAYPVRVGHALGATTLMTTGAAGGLNINYNEGDIVLLKDHINLQPQNPLRGHHDSRLGVRFPDMSEPYSLELRALLRTVGGDIGLDLREGVYAALAGPSLETKAEYNYLQHIGADLVGMSVAAEVIVGVQCQMTIGGICVVSNICHPPERITPTTIDSVIETVTRVTDQVGSLITACAGSMD